MAFNNRRWRSTIGAVDLAEDGVELGWLLAGMIDQTADGFAHVGQVIATDHLLEKLVHGWFELDRVGNLGFHGMVLETLGDNWTTIIPRHVAVTTAFSRRTCSPR
jgi:hypothetical protein